MRCYTPIDQVIIRFSDCLNAFLPGASTPPPRRPNPGDIQENSALNPEETQSAIRMMRVNHAGEVCAQALYQGQALLARKPTLKTHLRQAAYEEADHLNWCEQRIKSLGGKTSRLNIFWYAGSFLIGLTAGLCGDKISLGFLAETENQVTEHLQGHLNKLPASDLKSRAIVKQMQIDEQHHAHDAFAHGGAPLPFGIPTMMRLSAKIMTRLASYL
ncbi:MAG: 2-nonaprenyl-3-methyl-6-methoxy,4-benzoquinol hydroxylase [Pseudomonadota bacterium]|jgi:ubiquinone biosynthesis monooxygenase Coq7